MDWNESLWSNPVHDRCDELKRCQTREQQLVWLALGVWFEVCLGSSCDGSRYENTWPWHFLVNLMHESL